MNEAEPSKKNLVQATLLSDKYYEHPDMSDKYYESYHMHAITLK